jgi:hypothetical protein
MDKATKLAIEARIRKRNLLAQQGYWTPRRQFSMVVSILLNPTRRIAKIAENSDLTLLQIIQNIMREEGILGFW